MSKKKVMDALAVLSDPDDSDNDGGDDSVGGEEGHPAPPKRTKIVDVATLRQHGYTGGPSVLYVPEKDESAGNWEWSSGMNRKAEEPDHEEWEERQRNSEAVTTMAEESAFLAKKAAKQHQKLREGRRDEVLQHKKDLKRSTWKDKEKVKRDRGQQSRGKSTVEEEKRKAREYGVISGFD